MKRIRLFLGVLLVTCMGFAQNPFSGYGYAVQLVTLTSGQFEELHDADRIVEIGDVRFDTKAGKIVGRIEEREVKEMDAQVVSRFISIDPHCEKYYSISPYVYCMNNPIKYIDPDGRDIVIWYSKKDYFVFNGSNQSDAPNNFFVKSVIEAYDYNVNNGAGDNLKIAATSKEFNINVAETDLKTRYQSGKNGTIRFNITAGLKTDDGYILSSNSFRA